MTTRRVPFPASLWTVSLLVAAILMAGCAPTGEEPGDGETGPPAPATGTAEAADGLPIVYESRGSGDVALVFVHGWSCNRAFWREQVGAFAETHRVITLDLGGHGDSGRGRTEWRILDLAADVVAVADALALDRIVLVGHSMGGWVSLEAARRLRGRVVGIVGVDTLHDADFELPAERNAQLVAALREDYPSAVERMFSAMSATAGEELRAWIVAEARAATPKVAVALMEDVPTLDFPAMFREAGVPIRAINADSFPTDIEGNRLYADFDATTIERVSHFLQLERPEAINAQLRAYVDEQSAE